MRSYDEVGYFRKDNDALNEAYRTYASLYLDFVDDNLNHFFNRGIDEYPLVEADVDVNDEDTMIKAYMESAVNIAKTVLSTGYYKSFDELYNDYPTLKPYNEALVAEIY